MSDAKSSLTARPSGEPADAALGWSCPTCGAAATRSYCAACGERRLAKGDLSVLALLSQVVESVTNADGRIFRTFFALVLRPGELTLAYAEGRRKPYVAAFQLFLIANVAFFFLQSALGFHVLTNTFESHVTQQSYSAHAAAIADRRLAAKGLDRAAYEPVFDAAVDVNAKALVVLLVPACALLVWLMSLRSRRPGAVHWVFALHFVAFFLIAISGLVPLVGLPLSLLLHLIGGSDRQIDGPLSWLLVLLIATYTFMAFGRVYGGSLPGRVAKAFVLSFVLFFVLMRSYRFVVFLITLYSTT
jgi:hypothetical protein